ncbi:MAG: hypothetical protein AB7J63_03535 [Vicinamibacterales bacterium]
MKRTLRFGAGAIAVATWLAAGTPSGIRSPVPPRAGDRESAVDRSMAGLQHDVDRLHQRIAPSAVPLARRDLFRFRATEVQPPSSPDAPAPVASASPAAEPAPPFTLIGVAEDATPDGVVRTAIVSVRGDVQLLKPGDVVAGRFRVVSVDPHSLELTELDSARTPVTLTLR